MINKLFTKIKNLFGNGGTYTPSPPAIKPSEELIRRIESSNSEVAPKRKAKQQKRVQPKQESFYTSSNNDSGTPDYLTAMLVANEITTHSNDDVAPQTSHFESGGGDFGGGGASSGWDSGGSDTGGGCDGGGGGGD